MTQDAHDDGRLSAFLDGELSGPDQAAVAAAIASDRALGAKVERMRQADQALRAAIPLPPTPIHDPLRQLILGAPATETTAARLRRFAAPVGLALAAGLCGLMLGFGLAPRNGADLYAPASVVAALDGALSSQARAGGVAVLSSFEDKSGRACRHFSVSQASTSGEGIACRSTGRWSMVAWDATAAVEPSGFETAGASAALDAVQSALGAGDPMTPAEEAAQIRDGWR